MEEFFLSPVWSALMMFFLLWGPLLLLAAVCVATLNKLEAQRRRGLFALFFTMLGVAAVLFGGAWGLEGLGLVWRTWFREGLSVILWLLGLATGILTIVYARRWLDRREGSAKSVVTGLSAFCLALAMFTGSVTGLLWAMGPGEQVVVYDGQKMILGKWVWMDTSYSLYEYHGPLVRGAAPRVDWDWDLLEGVVIDAG